MTDRTIVDASTAAYLNAMSPNTVREYATDLWTSTAAADWDGQRLFLYYGGSTVDHRWTCSAGMARSLADWIRKAR